MKNNELYFTLTLTENEHYIVNDMIDNFCKNNDLILKYYRKFKTGHVPCKREIKITGGRAAFAKFSDWCIKEYIIEKDLNGKGIFKNYWRENLQDKNICDSCKKKRKIVYYGDIFKVREDYTQDKLCRECWNLNGSLSSKNN